MSRKLFLALISSFLLIGGLLLFPDNSPKIQAAHTANVIGWAWGSDDGGAAPMKGGIGWISFNSLNCDSNEDGVADGGDCGNGPVSQYGVTADKQTGEFSGYAWSSNYGWINFDPGGGYPAGSCSQTTDAQLRDNGDGTYTVVGWARVVSAPEGGWDGWICMSGSIPATGGSYGGTLGADDIFRGWSWGGGGKDGVVGWIKWDPWPGEEVRLKSDYSLTVEKPGDGEGTVTSVFDGDEDNDGVQDINCGDDCFEDYSSQTTVQLSASWDASDTIFEGWFTTSGQPYPGCEDPTQSCVINVDSAETVVARFRKTECSDGRNNDTEDSLIDSADPGCWTNPFNPSTYDSSDDDETDPPAIGVTVNGNGSVSSGDHDADGSADVSNCRAGMAEGSDACSEVYLVPTTVTLTATADAGSDFSNWTLKDGSPAPCQEGRNDLTTCTLTISDAESVVANFGAAPPPPPPGGDCPGGSDCPRCNDGIDNDGDGQIDWGGGPNGEPADTFCRGNPNANRESFNSDRYEI